MGVGLVCLRQRRSCLLLSQADSPQAVLSNAKLVLDKEHRIYLPHPLSPYYYFRVICHSMNRVFTHYTLPCAQTICAGHGFMRNLRTGFYDLGVPGGDAPLPQTPRLVRAWDELTLVLSAA